MPLSYPLALPTDEPWTRLSVTVRMEDVVAVSQSPFTFQTQMQAHPGQRWIMEIVLLPMRPDEFAAWSAFFAALRGRYGTFHLGDPSRVAPRGTGGGAPQVAGAGQTGQTLMTDGWTPGQVVLRAGDYFQLGSGTQQRLYMVLADVTASPTGEATLDIWPALRESPPDNEPLVLQHPKGTFRLATNIRGWTVDRALIGGFEFAAVEAV